MNNKEAFLIKTVTEFVHNNDFSNVLILGFNNQDDEFSAFMNVDDMTLLIGLLSKVQIQLGLDSLANQVVKYDN